MSAPEANTPPAPGDDQDAGLGFEFRAQRVQGVDRRLVDRVADLGPVEGGDHAIREPFDVHGDLLSN